MFCTNKYVYCFIKYEQELEIYNLDGLQKVKHVGVILHLLYVPEGIVILQLASVLFSVKEI